MRRTLVLLLPTAMLISGCIGASSADGAATAFGADRAPNVHDLLKAKSHVAVDGPTTLEFSFASASKQVPRIATTLLYLANATDTIRLEADTEPFLVALVPHPDVRAIGVCQDLPAGTHTDFRPLAEDAAPNLTDAYGAGWYHAIVVLDGPGAVRLTFGADEAVNPTPWTTDRTISPAVRSLTSGHQIGVSLGGAGNPWLAWLAYGVDAGALDAGGERFVRVGDACATDTTTASGTPAVAAAGNGSAPTDVLARYTPEQPALAPETTTLTVIEVTFKPLERPAPEPSTTPTVTSTVQA